MPTPPGSKTPAQTTVTLSLISHTNAGKTTLARTLLRRDVGEVKDAAHVTLFNESYTLLETENATLRLWDTPGFGDSARLLKRLLRERHPILWFLSQTWDRIVDKPLWCSQQALKNVREEADVVLYLVTATEPPATAAYVLPEMEILSWVGKPVLVLLNQTGPAQTAEAERAEVNAWRDHLSACIHVRGVLCLDAFARCWVQEHKLLDALAPLLGADKTASFEELRHAWIQRNEATFATSIKTLSALLTASVLDGVEVRAETIWERVGIGRSELNKEYQAARQALATRLADRVEESTNQLIREHGLEGAAARSMGSIARDQFHTPHRVSESIWGVVGSFAGGAMGGLIADLKLGGMTFGGGALLGGLATGLGAYALIRSYNLVRGEDHRLHWSREHFREQVRLTFLCYLAVAHFGRGRGEWEESSQPEHWQRVVEDILNDYAEVIDSIWRDGVERGARPETLHSSVTTLVSDAIGELLERLYPEIQISE